MDPRKNIDAELKKAAQVYKIRGNKMKDDECATIIAELSEASRHDPEYKVNDVNKTMQHAYYYRAAINFKVGKKLIAMENAEKYLATFPTPPVGNKFYDEIKVKYEDEIETFNLLYQSIKSGYSKRQFIQARLDIENFMGRYGNQSENLELCDEIPKLDEQITLTVNSTYTSVMTAISKEDYDTALKNAKVLLGYFPKDYSKKETKDNYSDLFTKIQDVLLHIHTKRANRTPPELPARAIYHSLPTPTPRDLKPIKMTQSLMTKFSERRKEIVSLYEPRNKKFGRRK